MKTQNMGITNDNKYGTKTGYLNKKGAHPEMCIRDRFLSISTSNFSHKKIGFFLIFEYLKYICAMSIENEKHGCL